MNEAHGYISNVGGAVYIGDRSYLGERRLRPCKPQMPIDTSRVSVRWTGMEGVHIIVSLATQLGGHRFYIEKGMALIFKVDRFGTITFCHVPIRSVGRFPLL